MSVKQLNKAKPNRTAGQKISFEYFAPSAKSVFLAGTFNNWNETSDPLKKGKEGTWQTSLSLEPGRYEFLYVVDGQWQCDQNGSECVPNPFGSWNCVVNVG